MFRLLRRWGYGTYHAISTKHLARCLPEFEYRWDTRLLPDGSRTSLAVKRTTGKRFVYHESPQTETGK